MRAFRNLLKLPLRFWKNDRGNVLMIFAFAMIPMLVAVGAAVDYSQAARSRSHLSASADAAALAASRAAQDYLNSFGTGSSQFATASGLAQTAADQVFKANQANDSYTTAPVYKLTMQQAADGTALASVSASGTAKTQFMYLVGIPTVPVSVVSQAQGAGLTYYQIVFVIDNSNSMAIAGDAPTIATMESDWMFNSTNYSTSCAFGCHDPNTTVSGSRSVFCARVTGDSTLAGKKDLSNTKYSTRCSNSSTYCPSVLDPNYYTYGGSYPTALCMQWDDKRAISQLKSYKLKIDYVRQAIDGFMTQMASTQTKAPNQFQVSVWAFGSSTNKIFDTANTATSDATKAAYYTAAQTAADNIDLEVASQWAPAAIYNHGYTRTSDALTTVYKDSVKNLPLGDGTSPSSRKTFFIILTDGAEDLPGSVNSGRQVVANYPAVCTTIKNPLVAGNDKTRPIIFSIEATYPDVTGDAQYNALIVNSGMKTAIPTAMQNCATPGNYISASDGNQIVSAVQRTFSAITASLHLTQ